MNPTLVEIPTHTDPRGTLAVVDFPFFRRAFWVSNAKEMRGGHSHLSAWQFLIPLRGTMAIIVSKDGIDKREFFLHAAYPLGVLVPPGWCISYVGVDDKTLMLVLCTESYCQDVIIPCETEDIHAPQN